MLRDALRAGFGSVGAQAINLAALPLIARLYAPEQYAVWAIVIATAMIFGGVACLRYELAIVLPPDREDASALFVGSTASAMGVALLVALTAGLLSVWELIDPEQSINYTLFAPLLVAATGITLALQHWAIRLGFYTLNSSAQIVLALVAVAIQIVYANVYAPTANGLIVGSLIGQAAGLLVLVTGCASAERRPRCTSAVRRRILPMFREHYRFPLYSVPYVLFGTIRERASVYVIALFLTAREVGLYAFAYRIINFPVSLVSAALRPVIYREASRHGVAALEQRVNLILRWLAITMTPAVVVYFHWSEELFALVFGSGWKDAAFYGDFFVLPMFTFMFCNWMDRILDVLGQQRLTMSFEIVFGSISVLSLYFALEMGLALRTALVIQCAVLIAYNLTYLVLAFDRSGYGKKGLLQHAIVVLTMAVGTSVALGALP